MASKGQRHIFAARIDQRVTDQPRRGKDIYPTEQGHLTRQGVSTISSSTVTPGKEVSMIIENSAVSMSSAHRYNQTTGIRYARTVKVAEREGSAGFFQNFIKDPLKAEPARTSLKLSNSDSIRAIRLQLLHRIFDLMRGFSIQTGYDLSGYSDPGQITGFPGGTVWNITATTTTFHTEEELTSYEANGVVHTSDGRTLDFGVSFAMTRSFTEVYEERYEHSFLQRDYVVTDPLVINLDTDLTRVTDQKFLFDLDCDGEKESISFAGNGSGFLALDLNEDGVINDGSELFGTKSGNGFADLSKYDSDGNGWIDEADEIFNRLRVWTKDEEGNDELIDLSSADVGAIFLGNMRTQFSLNDAFNSTNAYMRSSGIFLKESGGAGTIAQVDMVS